MLKRIVTYEEDRGGYGRIVNVSLPIDEKYITKNQLAFGNCVVIDAEEYVESKKLTGKKHTRHIDKETKKIIDTYTDLTFEEMSLEEKVNYLYEQLLKPKEPSKPEGPGKSKSETDE